MRTLNRLHHVRTVVLALRRKWLVLTKGIAIDRGASVSLSATLVAGEPEAITIADGTLVAFKTLLIAREPDGRIKPIRIGRNCFIGGGSTILPGVTIGDDVIVGAGSIVFDDVPSRCIVAGNPARVIREEIQVGRFGRLDYADENQIKYYKVG